MWLDTPNGGTNWYVSNNAPLETQAISDGDKGSVTVSGTGTVWTLNDNAATTAKLNDKAVTYAKIQDVSATNRVLGRSTAGAGVVEEIPCTSAGRAVIGAADNTAIRTAIGLGSLATASTVNGANWSGQDLALTDGGTGASLADPNTDAIMFWDDSAGSVTWLTPGTGITISGTTISSDGGSGGIADGSTLASGLTFPNAGLQVKDTDGSHVLAIKPGSNITANRILTIRTGDADRTLDLSGGDVSISTAAATVLDDASTSAMRTTLGVAIGSDVQAYNSNLASIASLTDPNADRIAFWDDSANAWAWLSLGTNLSISGTTINATGSSGVAAGLVITEATTIGGTMGCYFVEGTTVG
jgi:hypothetical protein